MPFTVALAIGAGTGLFNTINGYNATQNAADVQAEAEQKVRGLTDSTVPQANDLLSKFYQQNLGLLQPYMTAGSTAEGRLSAGLQPGGEFSTAPTADQILSQDPGYQFRLDQGRQALDRSAASRGQVLGGGQLKALTQYGQDYGSAEYGAAFNRFNTTQNNLFSRLSSVANGGLNATGTATTEGTTTAAGEAGNLLTGLGINANAIAGGANATASGYVGGANALSSGLSGVSSGISQAALLQKLLQRQPVAA